MNSDMGIDDMGIDPGPGPGFDVEAFFVGGRRTGALVRETRRGLLRTTLAFRLPEGELVHLSQETRFGSSVLDWTAYRYVDFSTGTGVKGTPNTWHGAGPSAVPSYAAHLLLVRALRSGAGRLAFAQFVEDGDRSVLACAFVREGVEAVDTPEGRQEALKVVLEVEGVPGNTFWCIGESVVKSDWQGGTSYATRDLPFVLGGLDRQVGVILAEALALPAVS
jgi:hypothetical protein